MASFGTCSPMQHAFARAYAANNGNGMEAARAAGYKGSNGTLKSRACVLLKMPHVAEAIRQLTAKVVAADIATIEEVKSTLTAILRNEDAEAKDRIAAGDKLLKCGGSYIQKLEVEHTGASVVFVFEHNGRGPAPAPKE